MATAPYEVTEAQILAQVVSPDQATLPAASAKTILELQFNQDAINRMNEPNWKNINGSVTF